MRAALEYLAQFHEAALPASVVNWLVAGEPSARISALQAAAATLVAKLAAAEQCEGKFAHAGGVDASTWYGRPSGEVALADRVRRFDRAIEAGQPALVRAMELQRKAATVGFDWNDPRAVLKKIREEADEIEAALEHNDPRELEGETGDLLFALVNLARHVGADPEMALRASNLKFERRFAYIERALQARGRTLEDASLEEMDALWNKIKSEEF